MQAVVITKDRIAQNNPIDDRHKKLVEILVRELNCIRMDS